MENIPKKTKTKIRKIAQLTAIALFSLNIAAVRAAEPKFDIRYLPPIGEMGNAEGRVVWDGLSAENAGQYAVIAMLHAVWTGGGGYYVKPYNNQYKNHLDECGHFSLLLTSDPNDANVNEIIFYFVDRANINFNDGSEINPSTMNGKYLATTTIRRTEHENPPPISNIRPGFVAAGTEITLSCKDESLIYYTLDGSNPITSSSVKIYDNEVFTVPEEGSLLIKAVIDGSNSCDQIHSLVWFPIEPLNTPFFGLNVSLALNGETFEHQLSEAATRERMLPVARLTKWVRTFKTLGNGNEYINKIAKEFGLRTMIGVEITDIAEDNAREIDGLRQILIDGPAPDIICVGNEISFLNIQPATLAACIDAVREIVLEMGLTIPIGTVDIANISWDRSVLNRIDLLGVNIYTGIWDTTPEYLMLEAAKQTFANSLAAFPQKMVLLTEIGAPYAGGTYYVEGGSQTASQGKAVNYLCGFLEWVQEEQLPSFYFEAYDEPVKSAPPKGHPIEQYFGIMNENLQIHSFYRSCLSPRTYSITLNIQKDGAAWIDHDKTFTLRQDGDIKFEAVVDQAKVEFIDLEPGQYSVYDGDYVTGKTITIGFSDISATLDYYTVQFSVTDAGEASGSTISASNDNIAITSGAVLLAGKTLVITATGAGADNYVYEWSGIDADWQAENVVTITNLQTSVNATCTVTGSNNPPVTFLVTVVSAGTGATGNGDYVAGALVTISAGTPPSGKQFKNWTSTPAVTFADASSANTSFAMPAQAVTVTATFENATGINDLLPDNPLKVYVRNGLLHITGLTAGETLSIYTATGALVHHSVVTSCEADINLSVSGVYVVRSGNNTVKVSFE